MVTIAGNLLPVRRCVLLDHWRKPGCSRRALISLSVNQPVLSVSPAVYAVKG